MTSSMTGGSSCNDKYIKVCEGTVRVKIERGDQVALQHFPIRNYRSLADAKLAARVWRDLEHLRRFGIPVMERVHQLKRRKIKTEHRDPETGDLLPTLPPGLSYGYHRGRLLYVVASIQSEGKPKRIRFPVSEDGIEVAIGKARNARLDALQIVE